MMFSRRQQHQFRISKMALLNSSVLFIVFLLASAAAPPKLSAVLQVSALGGQQLQTNGNNSNSSGPKSATANNSANPYWRRPGCHRVGHTRTISIPGCVKFNLSTNACRGYCMSFSIPALEDNGPLAYTERDLGLSAANTPTGAGKGAPPMVLRPTTSAAVASTNEQFRHHQQLDNLAEQQENSRPASFATRLAAIKSAGGSSSSSSSDENSLTREQSHQSSGGPSNGISERLLGEASVGGAKGQSAPVSSALVAGPASSIYSTAAVAEAERREVVSVSQCCNMMETEDVFVNLKCANETKMLMFKSAKTCECFFCKHV